jgi:hypothetical protein
MRVSAANLEAFMVVRHQQADFASSVPGVFPAGGFDDDDRVTVAARRCLVGQVVYPDDLTPRRAATGSSFRRGSMSGSSAPRRRDPGRGRDHQALDHQRATLRSSTRTTT